MYFKK